MSEEPIAGPGHNQPPVSISPPPEGDVLSDLRARHPAVDETLKKLLASAATVPEKITDDETAGKVQDLLRQMKLAKKTWGAARGVEKAPWQDLADAVFNYFKKPEDALDKAIKDITPRHTAYLEEKAAAETRRREEEARKEREAADKVRREAEEAAERKRQAEAEEAAARERAAAAERAREEAERRRKEEEEKAKAAKAEAERLERERKERDEAERQQNSRTLREMKSHHKTAAKLAEKAREGKIAEVEVAELDELILEGGKIGTLGAKLLHSSLLDEGELDDIAAMRNELGVWRKERSARVAEAEEREAAERRRKAEEEAEKRAADERARRDAERKADEERAAKARKEREEAEAAAFKAKEEKKRADAEARAARTDARDAFAEQKEAAKSEKTLGEQADRTERRADRMDRKIENASDADLSRTRSDRGTVGSLSGRWAWDIRDRPALLATLGPLGPHLNPDAVDAAVTKWMREHQGTFTGERVEGLLPGVVFDWEPESRIT